jgi:hypothetical protein
MSIANELTQQKGSIDDLAKLPQALIMQMAQKGQIREDMLAPILGLKAEMADAFARNEALKNAGQVPPTIMEQLLAKNAMAEQGQMPQMPQQMMPPQMPPQQMMAQQMMAQQMPQDVEDAGLAQLPIPNREYAGGGIVAFQDNPDQPVSSDMPITYTTVDDEGYRMPSSKIKGDTQAVRDFNELMENIALRGGYAVKNIGDTVKEKFQGIKDYFGRSTPEQYQGRQPPTPISPAANVPKKEDITIGPRKSPTAASNIGVNTPPPPQDNSLAEALKEIRAGIMGDANERKAARKEARDMRMLEASLGILGGESPYAFVNLGKGPMSAVRGYGEDIKGLRAEELDRKKQLSGLGLKGIELQQANKLLNAQIPVLRSQAAMYNAKARNPYGVAGLGGKVTPEVTRKMMDAAKSLGANPKSDPAFFASLDRDTQMALNTKVGSPSYNRGIQEASKIANQRMMQELDFIASRNRTSPTFSTTE